MPCGCNSICDNDCSSNQLCTGHEPACSNSYSFSAIAVNYVIRASHVSELEAAINAERTNSARRYNASDPAYCYTHTPGNVACSNNDFSSYGFTGSRSVGDGIEATHWDNIKNANNEVTTDSGYGGSVTTNFISQSADGSTNKEDSVIKEAHVTDLQTKINQTRNVCICDSHCNCNPSDCGCNGECPSDDYYYY